MWLKILSFELNYRKKRPANIIYFLILFILAFVAISWDKIIVGGAAGQVRINAPASINMMMMILSVVFFMIISAIMGVPVLREFEHRTEPLIFINPIKKLDYLLGRFLGSFIVLVLVFSVPLLWGFFLLPWQPPS